jgi:small subunit ribosomal protein S6
MLDPELAEERQTEIVTRVRELVERGGGSWVGHDVWGRRRLAYEIDKKHEGVYHLLNLDAEPATLDEVSRILKITDGVIRHLATHRIESRGHRGWEQQPEPATVGAGASGRADDTGRTEEYSASTEQASEEE